MIRRIRADTLAPSVTAIDVEALVARGIMGAIIDLDNTLVGHRALEAGHAETGWLMAASTAGLRVVVLTNNATPWAIDVAKNLGIPCIPSAGKPFPRAFRRALDLLQLPRESVVVIGDQYFTDVLGAKWYGLHAILVPPLIHRDPWNTRPLRWIARLLRVEHH